MHSLCHHEVLNYKEIKSGFDAADKTKINYVIYEPKDIKHLVLCIHGGCFQLGNETWNASQSRALAERNILVMQLNFRQTSQDHLQEAITLYY